MIFVDSLDVAEAVYVTSVNTITGASSYTFNDNVLPFGGLVVAVAEWRANTGRTLVSATMNGNAAATFNGTGAEQGVAAAVLRIDAGGEVDLALSFSGGTLNINVDIYVITGPLDSDTPFDQATMANPSDSAMSKTVNVDVPTGGVIVAGGLTTNNDDRAIEWTGVDEDHEVFLDEVFDNDLNASCGSASDLAAETGRAITVSFGGQTLGANVLALSWV